MMKFQNLPQWCAISLGVVLCWTTPPVLPIIAAPPPVLTTPQSEILNRLAQADIIYLAEIHDQAAHHLAQLQIIQALHQKNPRVAIALEMFQRPFQDSLNRYLAGEISESELRAQSEYDQRWGFDWEFYAPILRYAKTHQLPLIALNPPTEITRKVAKNGLESLSGSDLDFIPPLTEINTNQPDYRQHIAQFFAQHGGHGNSLSLDNFFAAQVLWDETMADRIVQLWRDSPNTQIIVLAGRGHIYKDYGIPSRVERRLQGQSFTHYSVSFPDAEGSDPETLGVDLVWN